MFLPILRWRKDSDHLMKPNKNIFSKFRHNEDGMTLVELMVAIVIIVATLLASAYALNAAFQAQAAGEIKSRAIEISREESEKAKQRNWVETQILTPQSYYPGEVMVPGSYKTESMITTIAPRIPNSDDLQDVGLKFLQYRELNGTKFKIETYVTRVTSASFDSAGANIQLSNATINGVATAGQIVKRITVVVSWDLGDGANKVSTSSVRAPDPSDCIPPRVEPGGGAGTAKWDAEPKIQACELRK